MMTIRMLAHPCSAHFRGQPVCVAFISRNDLGPNDKQPPILGMLGLKTDMPQARRHACIPAALRESAIIGMCAAGPLAFLFTHEYCRFATDYSPTA